MALGANVRERRVKLGLTQSQLAQIIGVSQVAIANLEKRDSKSSRNLSALANALQCTVQELELGAAIGEGAQPYLIHSVPQLELQQAAKWQYFFSKATKFIPKVEFNSSENVFCVPISGDSMTAPMGSTPSFPNGFDIHVDPNITAAKDDFVIAKLDNGQVVFKQLKREEGNDYLRSLNPNFDAIFSDFDIIGVVIAVSYQLN